MTSFHDDSHILSKLGILESLKVVRSEVASTTERDRFVEVDIDDSDSDSGDAIFDKDMLLSSSSNLRSHRAPSTDSLFCRFIILAVIYFALGTRCLPSLRSPFSLHDSTLYNVWLHFSFLAGLLAGRSALHKTSALFLNFICLITLLAITVGPYFGFNSGKKETHKLRPMVLNFLFGLLLYVGMSMWFGFFRASRRWLLILYMSLSLGCAISMSLHNATMIYSSNSSTLNRIERAIPGLEELDLSKAYSNSTPSVPKKPEVAHGIDKVETKTELNGINRGVLNVNALSNEAVSANSSLPELQNGSTAVITTSIALPTTISTPLTTASEFPSEISTSVSPFNFQSFGRRRGTTWDNGSTTGSTTPISPHASKNTPSILDSSVELFSFITLLVSLLLLLLSICICCVNFSIGVDNKVIKLSDPSVAGFTKGCKYRLILFFALNGVTESLLTNIVLSQSGVHVTMAWFSIFTAFVIATICDSVLYSPFGLWTLIVGGLMATVFYVSTAVLSAALYFAISIAYVFPILLMLHIEKLLAPRASLLMDVQMVSNAIGQLLGAVICWEIHNHITIILIVMFVLLTSMFPFVRRSISKAARLREVMEYSMERSQETVGEYLSLVQQVSDDDDDTIEMEDL